MASIIILVSSKRSCTETMFAGATSSADETIQFARNSDVMMAHRVSTIASEHW